MTYVLPVLDGRFSPGQPTADGDGWAEPPCGPETVINRMISSRSAADEGPMPGSNPPATAESSSGGSLHR